MQTFNIKIYDNGKISIPLPIRQALHLNKGDELVASLEDGKITLTSYDSLVLKVQQKVQSKTKGRDLVQELFDMRKEQSNDLG